MQISVNGASIYAYTGGKAIDVNQPSVVFIHGAGLDHTVWTSPARHFVRHGLNVLAIDLPGHGRSSGDLCTSIASMADAVMATVAAASLTSVCLVGHSMGSLVALDAAGRYQDSVRALALLGTSLPMAVTDALLDAAQSNDHAAIDMLTIWGYSKRAQLGGNEVPGLWMLGGTMRLFEKANNGVLHNDLNACNAYVDGLKVASQIDCESLLIIGSEDVMTPPLRACDVAQSINNCRMHVLHGSGHTMMSEQPDAVLDALRSIVLPKAP